MSDKFDITPVFDIDIEKLKVTDPAHADVFNKRFEKMVRNESFLKERSELLGVDQGAYYQSTASGASRMINGITGEAGSEEADREDGRAANAVDGDLNTYWHTKWSSEDGATDIENNIRNEYTINLKGLYPVHKLEYVPRKMPSGDTGAQNGRILKYRLLYSLDGENFTQLKEGTWANTEGVKTAEFEAVTARMIQIRVLQSAGDTGKENKYIAAAEFRVYSIQPEQIYLADRDHQHETVNGHTIQSNVPSNALFTDTGNIGYIVMRDIQKYLDIIRVGSLEYYGNVNLGTQEHTPNLFSIRPITEGTKIVKIKALNTYNTEVSNSITIVESIGPDILARDGNVIYLNPVDFFEFSVTEANTLNRNENLILLVYMA